MKQDRHLSIGAVVRETGLTERALRYYEQRGLIRPGRADNGRRVYCATDLLHLSHIVLLKKAGFSLRRIAELIDAGEFDPLTLVDMQLESLKLEKHLLEESIQLLQSTRDVLSEDDEVDMASLCEFIKLGEANVTVDAWQKIYDKYYTKEEQEHWKRAKDRMEDGFDQEAYTRAWRDLNDRIQAALPLDPASEEARQFLDDWNELLAPFLKVADKTMLEGAGRLWEHQQEWSGDVESPLSSDVWDFISKVRAVHA